VVTRLVNQGMPTQSLRKLLGHQNLSTMQLYARIHDETLHQQFKDAMSSLEAVAVSDWPRPETEITISVESGENRTSGTSLSRNRSEDAQRKIFRGFIMNKSNQELDNSV
jgi:hypothetical protein